MATAAIVLDHFPAIAHLPDGRRIDLARTVVWNNRVVVWYLPTNTSEPAVAFEADAVSASGTRVSGFEILTPDGVVRSAKARGCGCGNRLKSFDPYAGATRMAVH